MATSTPWLTTAPPRRTFSYRASTTRYGYACVSGRERHSAISASSFAVSTDTWLFDTSNPHSASVIALTLRVETPSTYICNIASTSAFSLRW